MKPWQPSPDLCGGVTAPITVQLVRIILPLMECGLQQPGVKPGLVYPVDVLAELLTDL